MRVHQSHISCLLVYNKIRKWLISMGQAAIKRHWTLKSTSMSQVRLFLNRRYSTSTFLELVVFSKDFMEKFVVLLPANYTIFMSFDSAV